MEDMEEFENPLDLDGDGEVGAFEMSILDEETEKKKGGNGSSGCCVVFLVFGASVMMAGWGFVLHVV